MSFVTDIVTSYRFRAAIVLAGVLALLAVAVYLDPQRLAKFDHGYPFLSPCGFLVSTGYPCPTCFMTRAFAYMMHGRPDKAFLAQPFGAALCLLVIYLGYGAVTVLVTNKPWQPFWYQWKLRYIIGGLVAAFLGGWLSSWFMVHSSRTNSR